MNVSQLEINKLFACWAFLVSLSVSKAKGLHCHDQQRDVGIAKAKLSTLSSPYSFLFVPSGGPFWHLDGSQCLLDCPLLQLVWFLNLCESGVREDLISFRLFCVCFGGRCSLNVNHTLAAHSSVSEHCATLTAAKASVARESCTDHRENISKWR